MVDYYNYKMSGSEEEFEPQTQSGMTKAELRRSNKPIMEKRRRARINQCLDELKSLILEAMKKDPTRHSKLEKADILEMTVKHLQTVQRQQLSTAVATDPAVLTKFRSGFSECATEVSRYVSHLENVDPAVKQRLVSHLNNCVSNLQQMAPFYGHYVPYMPERLYPEVKVGFQSDFQNGDENNNGSARIQIPNGVQLIPSRLPTGELALLVPQSAGISANFPFFPPAPDSGTRTTSSSAFAAVHRPQSPLLSPSTSTSSYGEENHHSEYYQRARSPSQHHHHHHQQQQQQQQPQQQQQRKFKIPEQNSSSNKVFSSSPDTQKPQISSSSDSASGKSPVPSTFLDAKPEINGNAWKESIINFAEQTSAPTTTNNLRQPLSVITDKTYNRPSSSSSSSSSSFCKKDSLKRHHSDGLLVISDKKQRMNEPATSSTFSTEFSPNDGKIKDDHSASAEDLSGMAACSTTGQSRSNANSAKVFPGSSGPSGPPGANGDMWRPW